jgi:hypothetical protein
MQHPVNDWPANSADRAKGTENGLKLVHEVSPILVADVAASACGPSVGDEGGGAVDSPMSAAPPPGLPPVAGEPAPARPTVKVSYGYV